MPARSPRALPSTTLSALRLEDRTVPTVWATPWPSADALTISFPNKDTAFATGGKSTPFQAGLNDAATAAYQREVLRAYQAWLAPLNVNVGAVSDDNSAIGAPGPLQGSLKYGDIRVAGKALPAGSSVATAVPFDLLGSGAGDVLINSSMPYSVGGANGTYDFFTVALHEAGHTLGLDDSADPNSVMYGTYLGPRTGPSAADLAQVKELYGARNPDRFDAAQGNDTAFTPTALTFAKDTSRLADDALASVVAAADITTPADRDTYVVAKPQGVDGVKVNLRTTGLSLLTAKVSVYTAASYPNALATKVAADPLSGDLTLDVKDSNKDARNIYVVVEANAATPYTVGRYRLSVGPDAPALLTSAPVAGPVNPDGGTDDTVALARKLPGQTLTGDSRWQGNFAASVEKSTDKDVYRVDVAAGSTADTLVAVVWATEANKLDPVLRAYDSDGARLPFDILSGDASTYTVQLRGVSPGRSYYLEVAAQNPADGGHNTGNYVMAADLRAGALDLPTLAAGTLDSATKTASYSLASEAGRLYYFQLDATGSAADVAVRATVYDSAGRAVGSFGTWAGGQSALELRLGGGTYTVVVTSGKKSGGAYAANFSLRGVLRDDPLGPVASGSGTATSGATLIAVTKITASPTAYQDPWFGL